MGNDCAFILSCMRSEGGGLVLKRVAETLILSFSATWFEMLLLVANLVKVIKSSVLVET